MTCPQVVEPSNRSEHKEIPLNVPRCWRPGHPRHPGHLSHLSGQSRKRWCSSSEDAACIRSRSYTSISPVGRAGCFEMGLSTTRDERGPVGRGETGYRLAQDVTTVVARAKSPRGSAAFLPQVPKQGAGVPFRCLCSSASAWRMLIKRAPLASAQTNTYRTSSNPRDD
jgi:hypothetical protein